MLAKMCRNQNTWTPLVRIQSGVTTIENSMEVLQKIKTRATI